MATQKPPYLVEEFFLKDLPNGVEGYLESRLEAGYELVSTFGQAPTKFVFKAVKK